MKKTDYFDHFKIRLIFLTLWQKVLKKALTIRSIFATVFKITLNMNRRRLDLSFCKIIFELSNPKIYQF